MRQSLVRLEVLLVLCGPLALAGSGCGDGASCPAGQAACGGTCVDVFSDRDNCGFCGWACLDGQFCVTGQCMPCQHQCMLGQKQCAPGSSLEFQVCGDSNGDTCLDWTPAQVCPNGQICEDGDCQTGCLDDCSREGSTTCDSSGANGVLSCGEFDGDPCLEWGGFAACVGAETCSAGLCSTTCQDECASGKTQCATPASAGVQTCGQHDADACLDWGQAEACQPGQSCVDGACTGGCSDECAGDQVRCADPPLNAVLTCGNWDADACLEYGGAQACTAPATCSGGVCSTSCQDDCDVGERECEGTAWKQCGYYDGDACRDWSGLTACGPQQTCVSGQCQATCANECPSAGDRQCSGSGATLGTDQCADWDGDGCLEWGGHTNCPAGYRCENAECVEDCTDDCDTPGEQTCEGAGYKVCGDSDADDCLDWSGITACGAGETCSAGVCSATCADECASGQRECFGTGWRECGEANDGDACRDWLAVHPCAAWEACPAASPSCVVTCSNDCPTQGAAGCTPDLTGTRTCIANGDADPCLEWSGATACGAGRVCDPATSQCVLACSDECDTPNERRCTGDGLGYETCATNVDGDACLEWGFPTSCPAPQTCSGAGVCSLNCTDDCSPSGALVCDAADPSHKAYRLCGSYDGDACLDLGSPGSCGYGQQCLAGACSVVCADGCATPGEVRCGGNAVEVCAANHDADECLEWGTQTACLAGELCWRGGCVSQTPPATLLINEILYDDASTDGEQVFIELWGPGGLSLSGYYLLAVNGSGGAEISRIYLDGRQLPADGHFVIATASADAALAPEVDMVSSYADLQNGPDNLQVVWAGGQVVDALGYGAFTVSNVFAGEGADYTQAAGNAGYDATWGTFCLSRSADHADSGVNLNDFFLRTACSPGWEGPGKVLWQLAAYGGTSSPALDAGGNIYTVDSWGDLYKASPDGVRVYNPLFSFLSSVALSNDETTLYVGSDTGVYALSASTGITIGGWPVETGQDVYSTPAVGADGSIYFGSRAGGLYSYSAAGALRWRYGPAGCAAGSCPALDSSPAVAPGWGPGGADLVVVAIGGVGHGELAAVNGSTGAEVWRWTQGTEACLSSPAIGPDGTIYFACDDGFLDALDPATGTSRAGFPVDIAPDATSVFEVKGCSASVLLPSYGGVEIYATSRADASNAFIFGADGSELWRATLFEGNSSFSLAANGAFHVHSVDSAGGTGYLLGYSAAGTLEWYTVLEESAVDWISSSPAISPAGVVYVVAHNGASSSGYLYAVQGVAGLNTEPGGFPRFHGNARNAGRGY
ncbi:MAG TPA: PQQ-binding-like beta-propeller repeat protein [Myxococcota bacterium]|nr:PQQ-binding-like beta-propeller repeat protein [Myxococcota bacterium]HRY93389.1 PQQ-binding-like beta-propeller repeat protein [Myxococcota bacterium]HSA20377.1 PQQ-binding-like beta-propeller repeat protein [Myxococcota bacterium]